LFNYCGYIYFIDQVFHSPSVWICTCEICNSNRYKILYEFKFWYDLIIFYLLYSVKSTNYATLLDDTAK